MKRNTSNFLFEAKIEENLAKLYKRKKYPHYVNVSAKNKQKLFQTLKWDIIKRHFRNQQQQQIHPVNNSKGSVQQLQPLPKEELIDIISRTLMLENTLIQLGDIVSHYRRLAMFFIFFQSALTIVFNAYNLVVFLLKIASGASPGITVSMLLVFYGFHAQCAFMETLVSIMAYDFVYKKIRETGSIMDEWNIYISDDDIRQRLSQFSSYVYNNLRAYNIYGLYNLNGSFIISLISGTTTYIIILIQYSGDEDIFPANPNNTRQ